MSKTIQINYGTSAENDAEAAARHMDAARAHSLWSGAGAPRMPDKTIRSAEAAALDALAKVRGAYEERIADLERELDARAKLAAEEIARLRDDLDDAKARRHTIIYRDAP